MIQICKDIRKEILRISKISGHGHIPTCFSVVEILYSFYKTMNHNPKNPNWENRDIFILSKGHASLAHYVILATFGYFDLKEVETFGGYNSNFGCHADRLKIPGIEASTGSLGHGIGLAVGIALANRILKIENRVYVLIGDGESNEGSVWEAIMVAVNLNLSNLTIIYDNNMSHFRGLQIPNPAERFKAFGCETIELNGHDVEVLSSEMKKKQDKVKTIVGNTKKGYGCKTLIDDMYAWHRRSPNDLEYAQLIGELDEAAV
jgi:transketolase